VREGQKLCTLKLSNEELKKINGECESAGERKRNDVNAHAKTTTQNSTKASAVKAQKKTIAITIFFDKSLV